MWVGAGDRDQVHGSSTPGEHSCSTPNTCYATIIISCALTTTPLDQGLANFCKDHLENTFDCEVFKVIKVSDAMLWNKSGQRQHINKWVWLCPNKKTL